MYILEKLTKEQALKLKELIDISKFTLHELSSFSSLSNQYILNYYDEQKVKERKKAEQKRLSEKKSKLKAAERAQEVQVGDLVWFKGTRDRHGIRRVIKISNRGFCKPEHVVFHCEQLELVHADTGYLTSFFTTPTELREDFQRGLLVEETERVNPVTTHSADKFGGFIKVINLSIEI